MLTLGTTPAQPPAANETAANKTVSSASTIDRMGLQLTLDNKDQSTAAFCAPVKTSNASSVFDTFFQNGPSQQFLNTHTVALMHLERPLFEFFDASTLVRLTDEFKDNFKGTFNDAFAKQPVALSESEALKSAGQTAKEGVTELFMTLSHEHKKYAACIKQFELTATEKKLSSIVNTFRSICYLPVPGMGTNASLKAALAELRATPTASPTGTQHNIEAVTQFADASSNSVMADAMASYAPKQPSPIVPSTIPAARQVTPTSSPAPLIATDSEIMRLDFQQHMHIKYMELVEGTINDLCREVRNPEANSNLFNGEDAIEENIHSMESAYIDMFYKNSYSTVESGANNWTAKDYLEVTSSAMAKILSEVPAYTQLHRYASYISANLSLFAFDVDAAKADYEPITPTPKTSAEPENGHREKIKGRWKEAARKTRKLPPAPTSLPPVEHQIGPRLAPMAPLDLIKPTMQLPVWKNTSPNMEEALKAPKQASQSIDQMQMKSYPGFVDVNEEARQKIEIEYATEYSVDSDKMQEISQKFEEIFLTAFNSACSKNLRNGHEESNALKLACRKATGIAIDVLSKSDDPAMRSYAEFFAKLEIVMNDVTFEDADWLRFTINYQMPPQPAEIALGTASEDALRTSPELNALAKQIAAAKSAEVVTMTESAPVAALGATEDPEPAAVLQKFAASATKDVQQSQSTKPKRGRKILGSKKLGKVFHATRKLFGKSKSVDFSTPASGIAKQDVLVRAHGVMHLSANEVIQGRGQQDKGKVQLLSAWQIPTSRPKL
jgi:hypothetical protein